MLAIQFEFLQFFDIRKFANLDNYLKIIDFLFLKIFWCLKWNFNDCFIQELLKFNFIILLNRIFITDSFKCFESYYFSDFHRPVNHSLEIL